MPRERAHTLTVSTVITSLTLNLEKIITKLKDKGLMTEEEVDALRRPEPGSLVTGRKLTVDDVYIPPQPKVNEDEHNRTSNRKNK